MLCPHCKSSYTELKSTKEELDSTTHTYKCLACEKTFTKTTKKSKPHGKTLLTVYGGFERGNTYDEIAEITETPDGTLYIKQKTKRYEGNTEFVDTTTVPTFKINHYTNNYNLEYNSFSWFNDSKGTLFSVRKIELSPALLARAEKSEAMRIALNGKVLQRSQNSDVVLKDVASWLNHELQPYKSVPKSAPASNSASSSSGGCYIATAVYGSYDCPEVWTLRRFRDDTLAGTWYGRAFIKTYYTVSPTLVKWFGQTGWFKDLWRGRLDKLVQKLQNSGVDSTPYQDKPW